MKKVVRTLLGFSVFLFCLSFFNSSVFAHEQSLTVTLKRTEVPPQKVADVITINLTFQIHLPKNAFIIKSSLSEIGSPLGVIVDSPFSLLSQKIHWPKPIEKIHNGIPSQVYENEVMLPLTITLKALPSLDTLHGYLSVPYCVDHQCVIENKPFQCSLKSSPLLPLFQPSTFGLISLLLSAFLGGILLNFMPCVLPVLSMKLTMLVKSRNQDPFLARKTDVSRFLGHFFGIFTFFFLFLITSSLLQLSGIFVGWGAHFQNKYILSILIFILVLCFLNGWGVITFTLSSKITTPLMRYFPHQQITFWSHYGSGFLMSILATPCTAPFLGAALGTSLFMPFYMKIGVFLMITLGLSLPYGALIFTHGRVIRQIRPGSWMQTLKKGLSLGFLGTASWLLWVLSGHLFSTRDLPQTDGHGRSSDWVPLNREKLNKLIQEDKIVLVNMTASWCVTCLANELSTFNTQEVKNALHKKNVHKMEGNWTRPSHEITQFLQSVQRGGIPLTVVYGPQCPQGKVLSELLSPQLLISAVDSCALPS